MAVTGQVTAVMAKQKYSSLSSQLFRFPGTDKARNLRLLPCSQKSLCNIHNDTLDGPHRLLENQRSTWKLPGILNRMLRDTS